MSWLEDDPEMLRAALEILDTWDGAGGSPGAASDETETESRTASSDDGEEPTSSGDVGTRGAGSHSINSSSEELLRSSFGGSRASTTRERRREEIAYLRKKVGELEGHLRDVRASQAATKLERDARPEEDASSRVVAVVWKDLALRQQSVRRKSELENAKLRNMYEAQARVARDLLKLMQKARRIEDGSIMPIAKRSRIPIEASHLRSEDDQLARIELAYANVDAAFLPSRFHDGSLRFFDTQVTEDAGDGILIVIYTSWVVPFPIAQVEEVVWKLFIEKAMTKAGTACGPLKHVESQSGDTLTALFTATHKFGEFLGSMSGKMIARRFRETEVAPPIFVSNMHAEADGLAQGCLEGCVFDEDGWHRVIPVPSTKETETASALTVVQSSRRMRLQLRDDNSESARQVGAALIEFVLEQVREEQKLKQEMVEDLLLTTRR